MAGPDFFWCHTRPAYIPSAIIALFLFSLPVLLAPVALPLAFVPSFCQLSLLCAHAAALSCLLFAAAWPPFPLSNQKGITCTH